MPKIGVDSNKPTTWRNHFERAISENPELKRVLLVEAIYIAHFSRRGEALLNGFLETRAENLRKKFFSVIGNHKDEFKEFFTNSLRATILNWAKGREINAFHESVYNTIVARREEHGLENDHNAFTPGFAITYYANVLKEKLFNDVAHQNLTAADIVTHLHKTLPKRSFLASRANQNVAIIIFLATIALFVRDKTIPTIVIFSFFAYVVQKKYRGTTAFMNNWREIIEPILHTKMELLEEQFVVEVENAEKKAPALIPYSTLRTEAKTQAPAQTTTSGMASELCPDSPLNTARSIKRKHADTPPADPKVGVVAKIKFVDITILEPPIIPQWQEAKCFRKIGDNKFCFGLLHKDVNRYALEKQITEGFVRGYHSRHVPGVVWDSNHQMYKVIPTGDTSNRVTPSEIRTCIIGRKTYELHVFHHLIDTHERTPPVPENFADTLLAAAPALKR